MGDLQQPITVTSLYRRKANVLDFNPEWEAFMGKPEVRGSIIIIGDSYQGKTRFALQFARYLTTFGKVLYNSLEEGVSFSMQTAFKAIEMENAPGIIHLLDQEPISDLRRRLKMRNSADFVFIDSVQYTFMDVQTSKELLKEFPRKLFVYVSHADGRKPKGALAEKIWYDSYVKIRVENFRAFSESRYGGGQFYDIWPEESKKLYAEIQKL